VLQLRFEYFDNVLVNHRARNKSEGGGDCDRMAKIHKCGLDKEPDLVDNMIQAADLATPIVKIFLFTSLRAYSEPF